MLLTRHPLTQGYGGMQPLLVVNLVVDLSPVGNDKSANRIASVKYDCE